MPASTATEPCPFCGEPIPVNLFKCPYCGEELADEVVPVRRARTIRREGLSSEEKALGWLVPVFTNPWAIASGYLGLLSCFPAIGLGFGVLAVATGIVGLRAIKRKPRSSGMGRAIFGIVFGGLGILTWGAMLVIWAYGTITRK